MDDRTTSSKEPKETEGTTSPTEAPPTLHDVDAKFKDVPLSDLVNMDDAPAHVVVDKLKQVDTPAQLLLKHVEAERARVRR